MGWAKTVAGDGGVLEGALHTVVGPKMHPYMPMTSVLVDVKVIQ